MQTNTGRDRDRQSGRDRGRILSRPGRASAPGTMNSKHASVGSRFATRRSRNVSSNSREGGAGSSPAASADELSRAVRRDTATTRLTTRTPSGGGEHGDERRAGAVKGRAEILQSTSARAERRLVMSNFSSEMYFILRAVEATGMYPRRICALETAVSIPASRLRGNQAFLPIQNGSANVGPERLGVANESRRTGVLADRTGGEDVSRMRQKAGFTSVMWPARRYRQRVRACSSDRRPSAATTPPVRGGGESRWRWSRGARLRSARRSEAHSRDVERALMARHLVSTDALAPRQVPVVRRRASRRRRESRVLRVAQTRVVYEQFRIARVLVHTNALQRAGERCGNRGRRSRTTAAT